MKTNKARKILALALALCLVVGCLPMAASAETYTGSCGENLTWTFEETNGMLTISGSGEMTDYDFWNSEAPWRDYRDEITSVEISNSVTSISYYSFYNCKNLSDVTIPDSVVSIGNDAFSNCKNLSSITIPDSVVNLGAYAFHNCSSLTSISLSDGLTCINGCTFLYCENLDNVIIPDGVTEISGDAFCGCTSLTSVSLPDSLTSIGYGTFTDCTNLKSIDLPQHLTSIEYYAFSGCSSLNLTIPASVTDMYVDIINDVSSLSIDSGNSAYLLENDVLFNKEKTVLFCVPDEMSGTFIVPDTVKKIGNDAFSACTDLVSVTLPEGLMEIGNSSFDYCPQLISINLPDSLTSIGEYAFSGCSSLNLIIPANVTEIYKQLPEDVKSFAISSDNTHISYDNGVLIDRDLTRLLQYSSELTDTSYSVPDGVTTIVYNAFNYCDSLQELSFPSSLVSLGEYEGYFGTTTYPSDIMDDTQDLKKVSVDKDNPAYSSDSRGVLFNKSKTELIRYPQNGEGTSYTIPDGVTKLLEGSFSLTRNLREVTIPKSVTSIGTGSFRLGNTGITDVYYCGTESDWSKINVDQFLTGAIGEGTITIHYNASSGSGSSGGSSGGTTGGGSSTPSTPDPVVTENPDGSTTTTETAADGTVTTTTTWSDGKEAVQVATPDGDLTITVTSPEGEKVAEVSIPSQPGEAKEFVDVNEGDWFKPSVDDATGYGLFSGTSETTFDPNASMTRGMLVQVLHNLSGNPDYGVGDGNFDDVHSTAWYSDAVDWAAKAGVVYGTSDTEFSPNVSISREQLVTMLYRYAEGIGAGSKNRDNLAKFPDSGKVSGYAKDAMQWAVAEGLIVGRGNGIAPQGTATRAEVAAVLTRFTEYLKK